MHSNENIITTLVYQNNDIRTLRDRMSNGTKFYVQHSMMNFSEDQEHEFKGHLCVAKEEVDPNCVTGYTVNLSRGRSRLRMTRAPASRSICGFLNTGLGGTIYFGVLDNGVVEGHPLSEHRKRHFLLSLKDTLNRFSPPVSFRRVSVSFVPVLTSEELDIQEKQRCKIDVREDLYLSQVRSNLARPCHQLRTFKRCWCVYRSLDEYAAGIRAQRYVVEVRVKKWNAHDSNHASVTIAPSVKRHRFHANEEGKFYYRGHGSVRSLNNSELQELTELHNQIRLKKVLDKRYEELERSRAQICRRKSGDCSESEHSFTSSENSFDRR